MGAPVARLGDGSSHGGTIITASFNVNANSIGVAREGDSHSCPIHGVTALISISKNKVNGQKIITVGAAAGCGAVINAGSPTVNSA